MSILIWARQACKGWSGHKFLLSFDGTAFFTRNYWSSMIKAAQIKEQFYRLWSYSRRTKTGRIWGEVYEVQWSLPFLDKSEFCAMEAHTKILTDWFRWRFWNLFWFSRAHSRIRFAVNVTLDLHSWGRGVRATEILIGDSTSFTKSGQESAVHSGRVVPKKLVRLRYYHGKVLLCKRTS